MNQENKECPKKIESNNAIIEINGSIVKKTLKKKTNMEKRLRFKKECEILQTANQLQISGVVEIFEINIDAELPYYTMRRYAGDSNLILDRTRGNIELVAKLMVPVVNTLRTLSKLPDPIFHRDLKPENLLIDDPFSDNPNLILADFGCAYMQDNTEDRITLDFRAVGARAFLAPEYHYGRVEHVNSSGDIFSIGKLLWYFVNGLVLDVFPYTLWFAQEYDLRNRVPDLPGIAKVNAIIAGCVHHNPRQRLSYDDLFELLGSLTGGAAFDEDENSQALALESERRKEIKLIETRSMSQTLIKIFLEDIEEAMRRIGSRYGEVRTIESIRESIPSNKSIINVVDLVSTGHTDAPIWRHKDSNFSVNSRLHSADSMEIFSTEPTEHSFISLEVSGFDKNGQKRAQQMIWYFDKNTTLRVWIDKIVNTHEKRLLTEAFVQILDHCVS